MTGKYDNTSYNYDTAVSIYNDHWCCSENYYVGNSVRQQLTQLHLSKKVVKLF